MAENGGSRKRERSPGYPGISLPIAIQRAQTLYERERRNAAPVATVVRHWGFKNPTNGGATVALAALEKFGLLEASGTGVARRVKLTELAFTILQHPSESAKTDAIRKAALNPPIYRLLWDEYQGVFPSDETLRYELRVGKRFSDRGATHFIPAFRATIAFAGLEEGAPTEENHPKPEDEPSDGVIPNAIFTGGGGETFKHSYPPVQPKAGIVTIPVLLPGSDPVVVSGRFPISEAAWEQFRAVLDAMKPGLVSNESSPDVWQLDDGPPEPA
jgi:hypothetical protein